DRDLDGRVALVTGGGRGIGRAIAGNLAARGANLVVAYLRNRAAAEETCAAAEEHAVKALAVRANVGDERQLDALFDAVAETFGRLDVFVSNAATGVLKGLDELDARAWAWTMDANARAFFLGCKRAAPLMQDGGNVVALSSQGSSRVLPGYMVVGASKAALEAVARYLAVELGPRGIRVNVVSPGVVDTDALRHFPARDEMLATAGAKTPLGRLATPQDVAATIDFLTSERAAMITGQTLVVDGGAGVLA
ncbi:MAG: SDR family oxidoreductase, partial [Actinomycetota bacterium]|nr:SDR family oxidoreductase [Actinomycetota bacterium]